MAMEPAAKVALLALVYREFEAGSRAKGTSLLKRMASDQLTELDALIVSLMTKTEELADLMVELAGFDELRCEALLYAWSPGPNDEPAGAFTEDGSGTESAPGMNRTCARGLGNRCSIH